ncbi:HIT family protein [Desulfotalea psychrophila]|nr:HIT domain-containing protein [Desulfotalea psychrophila]
MQHVLGEAPKVRGCLFEPDENCPYDPNSLLLYRDSEVIVLLNRFPYANGHLLVAPIRHIACLTELSDGESYALMLMVKRSAAIIKQLFSPAGLNIGCNIGACAGAGIADHLHFHIIPRWQGDHNFMTTLAEVRTIPQHIEDTFNILLPEFQKIEQTQEIA